MRSISLKRAKDLSLNEQESYWRTIQAINGYTSESLPFSEFVPFQKKWEKETNGHLFVIKEDGVVVGSISLAQIDQKNRRASCGYQVHPSHQNQGVCSDAFSSILEHAKSIGLQQLTAKIDATNKASLCIWEKYGATTTRQAESKVLVQLQID